MGVNYGKRSLSLDLKAPEAKEIVGRLVKGANAIAENFKPGVLNRLGFSYDWAKSIQPDIVYIAISGFGQEGPLSGAGAYDGAIQAMSGMMSATGTPVTGPLRVGFPVADMTTGFNAAFALASALYRQKATGEGQYLDLAMTDSLLSLQNYSVSRFTVAGDEPELLGNNSPTFQGTSSVFPTKDGFSIFRLDKMAPAFCDAIGHPEWKEEQRWNSAEGRTEDFDEIQRILSETLSQKTTAEWLIMEVERPVAPVNTSRKPSTANRSHNGTSSGNAGADGNRSNRQTPQVRSSHRKIFSARTARRPASASTRMRFWPRLATPTARLPASMTRASFSPA